MTEAKILNERQEKKREEHGVHQQRQDYEFKLKLAKAVAEEQELLEKLKTSTSNRSLKMCDVANVDDAKSQSGHCEPSKVNQQTRMPCNQSESSNEVFLKENTTYQTDYNNQPLIDMLQNPKIEIPKFDGNPLK